MARQMFGPRKQRTREHVIASQSVNHVERFIIDEGHTAQRQESDYGYDLILSTFDEQGYAESFRKNRVNWAKGVSRLAAVEVAGRSRAPRCGRWRTTRR